MRDDFRIGFGREFMAFFDQFLLQRQVVFDDAIVYNDNPARAIAVRMRVFFGRTAMGGPTSVANAVSAVQWILPDHFFEISQLAFGPPDFQAVVIP